MKFIKMHGCGNDYVFIDGFKERVADADKPALAIRLSDRHFGIGGDGVVFINPSAVADYAMEIYNMDGSKAEMCGNAVRCVGKYVYESGMTKRTEITVESGGRIKYLVLEVKDKEVVTVTVNMGTPEFRTSLTVTEMDNGGNDIVGKVGDKIDGAVGGRLSDEVNEMISVGGTIYEMTYVSMGNPHAVVLVDEVDHYPLAEVGPRFEHHERFPQRTNVEFVRVIDRATIQMRVWERGSGETKACGTGACAAAAACIINGLTQDSVTVKLLGGELLIRWDRDANVIYMTGPAKTAFSGECRLI
ncbi:MAG: diaminopimelate epimerase [Lachnospiraceae bacterium]|jgi:diaminopimelate epimerase|nr:diaminopimelate epimerase [Lachnospiraceae bacterium]